MKRLLDCLGKENVIGLITQSCLECGWQADNLVRELLFCPKCRATLPGTFILNFGCLQGGKSTKNKFTLCVAKRFKSFYIDGTDVPDDTTSRLIID